MTDNHRYRSSRSSVGYPVRPMSKELAIDLPSGTRWGVCLSHDVDHLGLREHWVDSFLFRYLLNVARQNFTRGRWRPAQWVDQMRGLLSAPFGQDRWDTVGQLLEREKQAGLRSTWFVAIKKGLGIRYSHDALRPVVEQILDGGYEIGLHGQTPNEAHGLVEEVNTLNQLTGQRTLGLRMHYLRLERPVIQGMQLAGLRYDSTVMDRAPQNPSQNRLWGPRLLGKNVVEIPLHIMDTTLFSATGMALDLPQAKEFTAGLLQEARENRKVVTVNLHPHSYSIQDPQIKAWFDWLIDQITTSSEVFLCDFRTLLPRVQTP